MSAKVSVILPTFNRAGSLALASQSVLNQSFRDLELIIVDDASGEDIAAVAEALGDPRVRYVRRETNGGASAARNTGLGVAGGAFIAFQDSDDLWLPGKLERQLAFFETLPADVGVVTGSKLLYGCGPDYTYGPGQVSCAPPPAGRLRLDEDQVRHSLSENRISLQNALFRRDCFPGARWFDPCAKANADWEFTVRLSQATRIYEDADPVVVAFMSEDSISRVNRKKLLGMLRIAKKNEAAFARYPDVRANHRITIARMLFRLGKRRWGTRLLLATLREHPPAVASVAARAARAARRRLPF